MAVNKFQSGGVDNNWGTVGNWSLGAVPTAVDGNIATFDATSPNCTVNTSARVCNGIDFTGYTNTFSLFFNVSVGGLGTTFGSGMTVAGSNILIITATSTLTTNGFVWPTTFQFATNGQTLTLADNAKFSVTPMFGSGSAAVTINGAFTLESTAGFNFANTSGTVQGTATFLLSGNGTLTSSMTTGSLRNNLTINTAGTITWSGSTLGYSAGTFTYTAGTLSGTAPALVCTFATGTTLATNGITWASITMSGSGFTHTLSNDLSTTGLTTLGVSTGTVTINGSNINAGGGLRLGFTSGAVVGTTTINLTGTGNLDTLTATTGRFSNKIVAIAGAGTITFNSNLTFIDMSQFLFTSGTIVNANGQTWSTSGGGSGTKVSAFVG